LTLGSIEFALFLCGATLPEQPLPFGKAAKKRCAVFF